MIRTRRLATLILCTLATGCQLASNAVHNFAYEAKLTTAELEEHCRYEKLARAAWNDVCADEHTSYSRDYAAGFKDGFVDFLQFGGTGGAPYVPPQQYWSAHYRTPDGYQAVQDWFAGFRHGVTAAQQSGYRHYATMPSAHTTEAGVSPQMDPVMPAPLPQPAHTIEPVPPPQPAHTIEPVPPPQPAPVLQVPIPPPERPPQEHQPVRQLPLKLLPPTGTTTSSDVPGVRRPAAWELGSPTDLRPQAPAKVVIVGGTLPGPRLAPIRVPAWVEIEETNVQTLTWPSTPAPEPARFGRPTSAPVD